MKGKRRRKGYLNPSSPSELRRLAPSSPRQRSDASFAKIPGLGTRPGATLAFSGFHMTRDEAGAVDFGSVVGDGFGFAGVVEGFFFVGENRTGRLGGRE
ncbi:unnamed protein product [Linum trigynum]|uniref:Uncharacterized protein n=1 Tax=Linum trigynum TaxID=586398 RepID=A0AAV2G175_9ROSI